VIDCFSKSTPLHECGHLQDFNAPHLSFVPSTRSTTLATPIATDSGSPVSPLHAKKYIAVSQTPSPITISDEMPASPSPEAWKKELVLTLQHKEELTSGRWLSDRLINAAQQLLKKQFPSQNGLQDTVVLDAIMKFTSPNKNFVQIIHVEDHWVCASNIFSPEGYVDVYDSMPTLTINSHCLKLQLAAILKCSENSFVVRHVNVQR